MNRVFFFLAFWRGDFAVVSGDEKAPWAPALPRFPHTDECIPLSFRKDVQRRHQRNYLQRTQKYSDCRENACPGKLLLSVWGATFVARRAHQSTSNGDVQKLPYPIISSSQDGCLWFEVVTRRVHTRLRRWFLGATSLTPRDGPWPFSYPQTAGFLPPRRDRPSRQRRGALWSFIQRKNKLILNAARLGFWIFWAPEICRNESWKWGMWTYQHGDGDLKTIPHTCLDNSAGQYLTAVIY